jgi:hypothetical protein
MGIGRQGETKKAPDPIESVSIAIQSAWASKTLCHSALPSALKNSIPMPTDSISLLFKSQFQFFF